MKQRESNFELLRIVSMLMVVLVHADGASLGLPQPGGNLAMLDADAVWQLVTESVTIIGVNCFTLISGYFGIRLTLRRVLSFLYQCLFYSVLIFLTFSVFKPHIFSVGALVDSFLVLSHTDLWYVPAYFGLMLLSPLINGGIDNMSRRRFSVLLLVFLAFNLWCGWWWQGKFNPTGYTIVQLILVYMIGRWLALNRDWFNAAGTRLARLVSSKAFLSLMYVVSVGLIFVSSLYMNSAMAFAYNSPLVLLSSVLFFLVFMQLRFRSRAVNWIAKSAFAVYLIHKNPLVWVNLMLPAFRRLWAAYDWPVYTLAILGVSAAVYLAALLVDPLRRFGFPRPTSPRRPHPGDPTPALPARGGSNQAPESRRCG